MKLVTFEEKGAARPGVLLGKEIADVSRSDRLAYGSVLEILWGGSEALRAVQNIAAQAPRVAFDSVKLLAPVPRPGKIICVGQNYLDHCREQNVEPPTSPILFAKYNNAVQNPGDPIQLPTLTNQVDYEAELAFVVGKKCRNVAQEDALEQIAGYTCLNDVSARDIQFGDKQWTRGKSMDTFCPMGPCLVTRDEIPDPQNLWIRCTVSGEILQNSTTSYMIFNCAYILSFISRSITLEPGDVVATGTPNGVGVFRNPQRFLKAGDQVTVSIQGIGDLTNPVLKA